MALLFRPLGAVHRPGSSIQSIERTVKQISAPAGKFDNRPTADYPLGTHELDMVFFNAEEIEEFFSFFNQIQGACIPFWIPSYQQDFDLTAPVGAADTTFTFKSFQFTTMMNNDPNRQNIAFVKVDGTFLTRHIDSCVDNGDGTETATINESLGEIFTQNNSNGVCFLWYARLIDDKVTIPWDGANGGSSAKVKIKELREPKPEGSGSGDPDDPGDIPDCAPDLVFEEDWTYADAESRRASWDTLAQSATGGVSGGTAGTLTITVAWTGGIGGGSGFAYVEKTLLLEPGSYLVESHITTDRNPDPWPIGVSVNEAVLAYAGGGPVDQDVSGTFVVDSTGLLTLRAGHFDLEVSEPTIVITISPITVTRVCP